MDIEKLLHKTIRGGHAVPTPEEVEQKRQERLDIKASQWGVGFIVSGTLIWGYGDIIGLRERCMTYSLVAKDLLSFGISITPICIAVFVAWVAWWQARINRDKLRLDLYNRRFDIYSKTLDFYQAVLSFDPSSKETFNTVQKAFIKAYRESQFLFDKKSGVYGILDEMNSKSRKILAAKEQGKEMAAEAPQEFLKMYAESTEALQWFTEDVIPRLENAMARYLNFHKITA